MEISLFLQPGHHVLSPCFKVLPMGFNWSFYLVQALHEQAAMDALGVSRDAVFLDGHPSPVLSKGSATTMPYCDNVHVLSLSPDICQTGKEAVCEKLEHMGFVLHERTSASSYTQTLGGIVDGDIGHIRCSEKRIWSLIFAFEYAATHKISTELMQRLLGHAMVVCTINRCGMAIFRRLYDFVHSGCGPRKLNSSEKENVWFLQGCFHCWWQILGDLGRTMSQLPTHRLKVGGSARDTSRRTWCKTVASGTSGGVSGGWMPRNGSRGRGR